MTVTYTFDVFSGLDSRASVTEDADWGGYWGKQGPELLEERLGEYSGDQRLVLGANTYRAFAAMVRNAGEGDDVFDPWVTEMRNLPTTVISDTLEEPLDWPDATLVRGDAVDVVARLKEQSDVRALAREPVDEPLPHGGRTRRPPPGDDLPGAHRPHRHRADLRRDRGLRPRTPLLPHPRRAHTGTHLPSSPALTTGIVGASAGPTPSDP